jgi:hypothetical protein
MEKSLLKRIKNPKLYLILFLVVVLAFILLINPDFKPGKSFEIEDKCGQFVNLLSHTIDDEAKCRSRCRAQCDSIDYKFGRVEFEKRANECNYCKCFCRKGLW